MELLTITQAARYVGLSRTSFYKLIERGDVRPVRLLADAPRVLKADLDALVAAARQAADECQADERPRRDDPSHEPVASPGNRSFY